MAWADLYRRRMAALQAIKMERGCVDCGYREHPAALQFDHRDPATKHRWAGGGSLAQHITRRWTDVLAEVEKCDVRCANCHAVRTATERHMLHRSTGTTAPEPEPGLTLF